MSQYTDLDTISVTGFTAGCDLAGTESCQTVIGLQGNTISNAAPTNGQVLTWNASSNFWEPATSSGSPTGAAGGDLSGTYPNPTVAKLQGRDINPAAPNDADALVWDSGNSRWSPLPKVSPSRTITAGTGLTGGGDLSADRTISVVFGSSAGTVTEGNDSRLSDSRTPTGSAGGDLSGTYPNPTVAKLQSFAVATTTPTDGYVLEWHGIGNQWEPTPLPTIPTTLPPDGPAGGDLSGTYPNPSVIKIQGFGVSTATPTDGYALIWDAGGNQWEPTLVTATASGTAGGDLSGTYPNPTVAKINGTSVSTAGGSLTTGNVLRVTSGATVDYGAVDLANSNAVTGVLPTGNQAVQSLAGDASGTTAAVSVNKIRGNSVKNETEGSAQDGYVLTWVNSNNQWEAKPFDISGVAGGDLSGTYPNPTVAKINATTVFTAGGSLVTGEILRVIGASTIDYGALDLSNANAVTGTLPKSNQEDQTVGGDLSGTTGAAIVVKIQTKTLDSALSTIGATQDGYVLTWVDADNKWEAKPTAPTVTFAGDLSGTTSSQTVEKIKGTTITTAGGSLATGAVLRVTGAASADWGAVDLADTDAVTGVLPKGNQANQDLAGDVTGNTGASVVAKINGTSVPATPSADQVLVATSGTAATWQKLVNAQIDTAAAIAVSKLAAGTAAQILLNNSTPTPTWTTVSGDATISNAGVTTVGKVNGTTISTAGGSLSTGSVLRVTGAATADWGQLDLADTDAVTGVLPKANQAAQDMAGDVSGTTAASVVDKLKGKALDANVGTVGAGQDQYVLTWNNATSTWKAIAAGSSGVSTVGTIDSQTKSANGAVISGTSIYLQTADATNVGLMSTGTQTIAGAKTFSGTFTTSSTTNLGSSTTKNTYSGGQIVETFTCSSSLTLGDGYYQVFVDTSAARSITLPAPANGREFWITDTIGTANTNNITLVRNGTEKINGVAASKVLQTNWGSWRIISNGTDWFVNG